MTDRELLELAAKAAFPDAKIKYNHGDALEVRHGYTEALFVDISDDEFFYWNPLERDGDALRLAVKLGLFVATLYHSGADMRPGTGVLRPDQPLPPEFWSFHGDDPYAATRRTIVRAAAEIGRATP